MSSGRGDISLAKKLGIREHMILRFINPPPGFIASLLPLPTGSSLATTEDKRIDYLHLFPGDVTEFRKMLRKRVGLVKMSGLIWVAWDRKKERGAGALNETLIRTEAMALGLAGTKTIVLDATWSAVKLQTRSPNPS